MTEEKESKKKILEVEDLLESLSVEMVKLKTASQHYDETQEALRTICESIDKIAQTNQEVTNHLKQFIPLIENNIKETTKNQELMLKNSKENQHFLEATLNEHKEATNTTLTNLKKDLKEQKDSINTSLSNQNEVLSKKVIQLKSALTIGISLEAVMIIILLILLLK